MKFILNKKNIDNEPKRLLKRSRQAVFAFYFCQGLVFSSWASLIPDIKASLGVNDAVLGTMLLMISVGQMCGMAISGFIISRVGSRKVAVAMMPFYVLILLPVSLITDHYIMMMVLIIYGFFNNFVNIAVNTQGVNVETFYNKSIMSSFHGGWSIAGFVGSLIGLLMMNLKLTPFWHFLIMSFLVGLIILTNYKYLQPDIKRKVSAEEKEIKRRRKPEKFLFLLGLVAFCGMVIEGTMFDWSGIYFEDIVGAPRSLIPLGFAGFMVMMASGRFVADRFNEKWGRKRLIQVCGTLAFTGITLAVVYPNIFVTTIAFMIVGLGVSGIVPTIYSLAGQKTRISTGLALALVSSVGFLGFLLGPPIIGYISHATSLRYSYACVTIFAILIIIIASNIRILKKEGKTNNHT